jgi:AraC-like DNA-binding protein
MVGAAVLAACAFAGGAYAATSGTNTKQAFLNDVAKRLHVTPQQLKTAFQGAVQDQLNAAVKAGKLTQAQANAIEKRIREGGVPAVPFFRRGLLPLGPGQLPFGPGHLPFGPKLLLRGVLGGPLATAARYIGVTPMQLLDQLGSGKSLAQVATAHGKSVSGLENAIVSAERSRLDQARQHGLITSSQEQRLLSRLQAKIAVLANRAGFGPRLGPLAGSPPGPGWWKGPRAVPVPGVLPGPPPAPAPFS